MDVGDLDLRVTDFDIQDLGGLEDVDDETEIEVSMPEKRTKHLPLLVARKRKRKSLKPSRLTKSAVLML